MFSARQKILKPQEYTPTEVEASMAQALYELQEAQDNSMKEELQDLHFLAAREITVSPSKKAIVVFVPYVELKAYHRIQVRLVRELEKKFSGKHVVVVAQRRIIKKPSKNNQRKMQKRPMSRTKQAVHDAIIEDLCFPTEVVGKRLRFRLDGSQLLKVHLDHKDEQSQEARLATYQAVMKKLTGVNASFLFPVITE
eukprot:TRINITY_DN925_c0_g1_i2.p2 TRINITY_DN925_c0_g1~~TRINITY_DN925_c0_g1_i2.p2  ORF type:complete len:212 (-),score=104.51 TRINITY_DN925_c0_g1_i2:59-646(-)